jgi:hypothetical protein
MLAERAAPKLLPTHGHRQLSAARLGFAQFDDGKPASEAVHDTCFPSHAAVKACDFVFNRYAP